MPFRRCNRAARAFPCPGRNFLSGSMTMSEAVRNEDFQWNEDGVEVQAGSWRSNLKRRWLIVPLLICMLTKDFLPIPWVFCFMNEEFKDRKSTSIQEVWYSKLLSCEFQRYLIVKMKYKWYSCLSCNYIWSQWLDSWIENNWIDLIHNFNNIILNDL